MKLNRQFATPWPAVLVEVKDFVELARLVVGGRYRQMQVRILIGSQVPVDALSSPAVEQFRAWLEAIPRCRRPPQGFFASHNQPLHRIDIEIES